MKVEKITAYRSADGSVWEAEASAIQQNIEDCIESMNHDCGSSGSNIYDDVKKWCRDHPRDVRYILANINKIKDLMSD